MRAPLRVSEPAIRITGNGVMNDTEAATGAEPLDPKPPSSRPGALGTAGAGPLTGAGDGFGVGVRTGVRLVVVTGGRVVVVGLVVVGTVVLDPVVEVDPLVLVFSSGTLVPPPSLVDPVPVSLPDSFARLATGPSASRAPRAAAMTKPSGD